MRAARLQLACPLCGAADVFYSCTPACCFNHVCAACGATFEPVTVSEGGKLEGIIPPDVPAEATDPTAACARCESTAVYTLPDGMLVCGDCGALLKVEYTEVTPG